MAGEVLAEQEGVVVQPGNEVGVVAHERESSEGGGHLWGWQGGGVDEGAGSVDQKSAVVRSQQANAP